MSQKITLGILAHVDAGKTTLAEAFLYLGGKIRSLGRVDHKDAFLDNFALERERGITIFSKQALFAWKDLEITLLDTPGHADFSAEMERTLQVLDYAVLVISGADGVQGHTRTLWRLLKTYGIPTFLFINKMDQEGTQKEALRKELQSKLDAACVPFDSAEPDEEQIATCSEMLLEEYVESGTLQQASIAEAVSCREVFPCYFGSALKLQGVEELLDGIAQYALQATYPQAFGARVFKISRDQSGNRLVHMKVTGGVLRAKQVVDNALSARSDEEAWQEKVDQIRFYHGAGYQIAEEAPAGAVCAVTGLNRARAGEGLGQETACETPILEPVLTYQILLPQDADAVTTFGELKKLEEEDPLLHLVWKEKSREIHAQVMGQVQIEVLKRQIADRFGMEVEFGSGSILYKETLAEPAIGYGHFEPLRHYAEVQLLLEPGEPGSGMQFASLCSEDMLDKNWQRLVLTHLEEKKHIGVLTGSELTDVRISLIAGRAHAKHTEGGDFRQATYRAVRQGLCSSKNILLEPVFAFVLEVPTEHVGRAMSDIQRMNGHFDAPVTQEGQSILTGRAPVQTMREYQREVNAYTRGFGRLSCMPGGYEPCHNAQEVIEQIGYDPEADVDNPTGSVFCAHGAGFVVPWKEVAQYVHVDSGFRIKESVADGEKREEAENYGLRHQGAEQTAHRSVSSDYITQEEIEAIFRQSYGRKPEDQNAYRRYHKTHRDSYAGSPDQKKNTSPGNGKAGKNGADVRPTESYLLVDGYNIIFAWQELRELAGKNIDSARDRLMDILCDYQGMIGSTVILVFDAYKVKGGTGSVMKYHNIYVVYTKEAETADQYIEKTVHEIGGKYHVTVATSDALEQMIIWGEGAGRLSAKGLLEEVESAKRRLREQYDL